ncbi:2-keto-4-pentenoate hydratase [Pleomorphomonas sp. JP5]|uniref:2-keto-4-pentenoate hydratase n=1 Tax=Pleomorphomonas sp. JP5 TaxID=2942998 RepID=UPI002042C00D|nr:fumarylacetoacetate hydrolase family protein [Pleomorphomonas sp. JP5]MCM5560241.1 fumarylacetoacetate hydrolase family protein [Pleomorphomonas sp. JP5]
MSLQEADVDRIAAHFVEARRAATALDAFPGALPDSLADAYRVQERAIALSGRSVAGWKVAGIRPDLRETLGASRLAGPIMSGNIQFLPDGGTVRMPVFAGGFAALEAEFVAIFARDLLPVDGAFSADSITASLSGLHAGSEIASSPLATLNDLGPTAVVSDHGNNAGAVVGPEVSGWRTTELSELGSRMSINGSVAGEGSAANVVGGPIAALQFLAEHLLTRGRHLRAGDIVLTGMTTGIHQVVPGDRGRIEFSGAAPCDIEVFEALPAGL